MGVALDTPPPKPKDANGQRSADYGNEAPDSEAPHTTAVAGFATVPLTRNGAETQGGRKVLATGKSRTFQTGRVARAAMQ